MCVSHPDMQLSKSGFQTGAGPVFWWEIRVRSKFAEQVAASRVGFVCVLDWSWFEQSYLCEGVSLIEDCHLDLWSTKQI